MSQLIQLKQRIKAIEVIKKITHAMRLIAMSSHSKLKRQSNNLQNFKDEVTPLLCALEKFHTYENEQTTATSQKHLWILFASEKGLCGNFNSVIFNFFEHQLKQIDMTNIAFITIGKQATDFLKKKQITPLASYNKLTPNKLSSTATALYTKLLQIKHTLKTVTCFYNHPKSFFVQEPCKFQLLPVQPPKNCDITTLDLDDYTWPQSHKEVLDCIFHSLLKLNILYLMSESMIAEQSARFLSMDSSTRSAENLLKSMNLEYNKIRQAKITKELTELISSF